MSKLEPIGKSKVINNLKSQLSQIAKHDAYVLMRGESGTNKELLARYLHSLSSRSDKPFLTVNVSTLNSENPQKELFGFVTNNQIQEVLQGLNFHSDIKVSHDFIIIKFMHKSTVWIFIQMVNMKK